MRAKGWLAERSVVDTFAWACVHEWPSPVGCLSIHRTQVLWFCFACWRGGHGLVVSLAVCGVAWSCWFVIAYSTESNQNSSWLHVMRAIHQASSYQEPTKLIQTILYN